MVDTPVIPKNVKVFVDPDAMEAVIVDEFFMSDDSRISIKEMTDEQIVLALGIASRVGKRLEAQGFHVTY